MMAQFPSKEIARLSYEYRTLGLGYANIGGLLMTSGIPYDFAEGRAICASLTAIMTGIAYATSAEMAGELGAFPDYDRNAANMLRVMRNHRRAARGDKDGYEKLSVNPVPLVASDLQAAGAGRPCPGSLGRAIEPRREARLPQRADDGDRADRHDRPADGLRHHRHRARLRAGEVQEARRRRLLQDHQSVAVPGRLRASATRLSRSPRSMAYVMGTLSLNQARSSIASRSRRPASPTRRSPRSRPAPKACFDISFVFNSWTLGARLR